jgi:hypothetical protein
MAKLTSEEISTLKVIRATFESEKWNVLVSDENNIIYGVRFDGTESDDNTTLLTNLHTALLEVEKYEPVVIPQPIVREDLIGLNPTN